MPPCSARRSTAPRSSRIASWWDRVAASRAPQPSSAGSRPRGGAPHERRQPAHHHPDRRARRRRRRRAHRLDRRRGRAAQGLPVQCDLDPRRRAAHRRHHLLHRDRARAARELGGRRPVLALTPGVGDVDIVVASELLEAGRAIAAGFVTPDRTLLIASTSRVYLMDEKMRDGRRPLRLGAPDQGGRAARARRTSCSTWRPLAEADRRDDQRGDARR